MAKKDRVELKRKVVAHLILKKFCLKTTNLNKDPYEFEEDS